jgi:hypothetical protein
VTAYSSSATRSALSTEPWVGTAHAVGQRVTPFVRIYSSMTELLLWSEIICIYCLPDKVRAAVIGCLAAVGGIERSMRCAINPSHCSQAEAIEAAAAQTAAQTPSDDSRTISHRASFVSVKTPFCLA